MWSPPLPTNGLSPLPSRNAATRSPLSPSLGYSHRHRHVCDEEDDSKDDIRRRYDRCRNHGDDNRRRDHRRSPPAERHHTTVASPDCLIPFATGTRHRRHLDVARSPEVVSAPLEVKRSGKPAFLAGRHVVEFQDSYVVNIETRHAKPSQKLTPETEKTGEQSPAIRSCQQLNPSEGGTDRNKHVNIVLNKKEVTTVVEELSLHRSAAGAFSSSPSPPAEPFSKLDSTQRPDVDSVAMPPGLLSTGLDKSTTPGMDTGASHLPSLTVDPDSAQKRRSSNGSRSRSQSSEHVRKLPHDPGRHGGRSRDPPVSLVSSNSLSRRSRSRGNRHGRGGSRSSDDSSRSGSSPPSRFTGSSSWQHRSPPPHLLKL
ncbi:unnamed protein product [Protopolystoma xenopodis]|uniref:Uncharacterized protein n=1 Tax=Protopolystoma xenopodis TaxID=117903 RepID=A0A448WTR5_9PLAT|nr:unnamed protein product [Protopolystoma xenopodis]